MCDFHWVDWSVADRDIFVFDQDIQILRVAKLLGYTGGNRQFILERHWKDTRHFSFGAEFQLFDWLSLRAGYEPRPSSVPKKYYDITWPIQDLKIYTCGAGIRLNPRMSIDIAFAYLKSDEFKLPNNTSEILNSTNFTKIVYNPYAGLDYEQDTEAHLISINFNYKWLCTRKKSTLCHSEEPFAHVILRSEATKNLGLRVNSATKNLNDIRFFAIPFVILRASAYQTLS